MRATILLAHGSRDPLWRRWVDSVAQRVLALDAQAIVRCAFLELSTPDLTSVARELVTTGATEWVVVPLFLGLGKHVLEDLPRLIEQLRTDHPDVIITCRPSVGEEPQVLDLLAKMALS
ncbi:MAG: CbiX/SirB N-terminal domain-containing protein [Rhodoferax sp.]|nr:CbiX/SirB N-terminal domain-containing protein [Rhodoferax sp.]